MAEIDAYFKTRFAADAARYSIDNSLAVTTTEPVMVTPRNGRPWEVVIRTKDVDLPSMATRIYNAVLTEVTKQDGEIHEAQPSGSRLVSDLPQSVIDRYNDEQNS